MKLADSISRLERAGSEHSVWMDKLREAIDQVIAFLKICLPEQTTELPRNCVFKHWPSGEWSLSTSDKPSFVLKNDGKSRDSVLAFAYFVASGWLDEVAGRLGGATRQAVLGFSGIFAFLALRDRICLSGGTFQVRVMEWKNGQPVVRATHEQKADSLAMALLLVAATHCGGRVGYDPGDDRCYVSIEGWTQLE